MYYSFLPARFTSFAALERLVAKNTLSPKIIPVIEQLRVHESLLTMLDVFIKNNRQIALFVTSDFIHDVVHSYDPRRNLFLEKLRRYCATSFVKIVLAVDKKLTDSGVTWVEKITGIARKDFMIYLGHHRNQDAFAKFFSWDTTQTVFVESNIRQARKLQKKVLMQNIVLSSTRLDNADQFITDLPYFYQADGFVGYADRLTTSALFESDNVTRLPILYAKDQEIWVRVFTPATHTAQRMPSNIAKQFNAMLSDIIAWCYSQHIGATMGLAHLLDDFKRRAYPGSVVLQMRTIMHTLEIISRELDRPSASH